MKRGARSRAGHVLVEALVGGSIIVLVLAGVASSEIAARRGLDRGIDEVERARAAAERLEFLRAQPSTSAAWTAPSTGPVSGHPGWTWSITPDAFVDTNLAGAVTSVGFRRARVRVTDANGEWLEVEALRW